MKWYLGFMLIGLVMLASTAQRTFERGEFDVFIEKTNANPDENDPETNFKLGEAYRLSNRIQEALPIQAS